MTSGVRVRFAPSTSEFLDIPRARTALVNWLFARKHGGRFILRVEDTTPGESSQEQIHSIIEGMMFLDFKPDEGPFFQSTFVGEHRAEAERLLEHGHAYRCFCTSGAIESRRRLAEEEGRSWRYDGACLSLTDEERARYRAERRPFSVRFKVPSGNTTFPDFVHGVTRYDNADIEDFLLLRRDGTPTPDLSDVCDDIRMRITHIIRGDEHLTSTPRQILLYRSIGADPPIFAHLPVVRGRNGERLTGESAQGGLLQYRDLGILPDAMINFLALLGWSPGDDRRLLGREELIEAYSFEGIAQTGAVFDPKSLYRLNARHIRHLPAERLFPLVREALISEGLWIEEFDEARREWLLELIELVRNRAQTIRDFARYGRPFLTDDFEVDRTAERKHQSGDDLGELMNRLADVLDGAEPWNPRAIERAIRSLAVSLGIPASKLIQPARVALTGRSVSPGIYRVIAAIGRSRCVRRLRRAAVRDLPAPARQAR